MLDLGGRLVLLVGGGRVAARKLGSLLQAGARVRLVAPELDPAAAELAVDERVEHLAREFRPEDLEGVWLAISATDREEVNRRVAQEAERRRVFVNVVDVPGLCSFIVPAVLRRGELCLAVSTGGASPAAAARLRRRLEEEFGPEWGPYLELMRAVRRQVLSWGRPAEQNRPLFEALAEAPLLELLRRRDQEGIDRLLRGLLGPEYDLAGLGVSPERLWPRQGA